MTGRPTTTSSIPTTSPTRCRCGRPTRARLVAPADPAVLLTARRGASSSFTVDLCDELLDSFDGRATIDGAVEYAQQIPPRVIAHMMGFDEARVDEVVIDRERNRHVAFGVGIHRCAGSNLARMATNVAIGRFLERIPELVLADPEAVTWAGGQVRGPRRLPIRIA